ncbi:hypothetical protein FEA44_02465 [Mannheimia haemolytica]|uniref:Uncharacterized protein n=2 Tax=Mannheimia haemolytica TaxID=75985 RepID=A0A547EMH7_MANHA|nr:hypothetical protein [Mannheimia haemolytica]EPY98670.1 hypothetical protein L278_03490 [Mannheimia haemolytica D35]MDW1149023.1 hypothetical protein [Mannheimia haemolytica]MDW1159109.1 hypothetical protein [Mannheimia haemolytica]MEE3699826.1 hypothetical protein [Mannheimia haemolytica]TRB33455.1 hypothetical protein FEB90_02480 [Mannheimia haemolytica]
MKIILSSCWQKFVKFGYLNGVLEGKGKMRFDEAKLHAESEFEKYRIVQDRLFESDFDKVLKEMLRSENQYRPSFSTT